MPKQRRLYARKMFQSGDQCPDCSAVLYRTRLEKRLWCKICREFKDENNSRSKRQNV